jgi:hypothetical protein
MNCHAIWNRPTLVETFTKSWVTGEWKAHREALLFERERGMMPATQIYINWIKEGDMLKAQQKAIIQEIKKTTCPQRFRVLRLQKRELFLAMEEHRLNNPTLQNNQTTTAPRVEKKQQMICPCPVEACQGFIEKSTSTCGICKVSVCKECHELWDDHHTCKPENVLTAKALANESKPCPHCAVPTFRISGCSQMWCVVCHKPWDWNTGDKVLEGEVIHNPHYFEWAKANKREDVVWLAAEERWQHDPTVLPSIQLQIRASRTPEDIRRLVAINRRLTHLWGQERRKLAQRGLHDNLDLRVKFMLNQMTQMQFMRLLQQREKKNEKNAEYSAVLTSYYLEVAAILKQLCIHLILDPVKAEIRDCFRDIEIITQYYDERLRRVASQYDAVCPKYFKEEYWAQLDREYWAQIERIR